MDKIIDVQKLIESKNPRLLKFLPGFVVKYLERILHQKDINTFLNQNKDKHDEDFCDAVMEYLQIKVIIENPENIPKEGKLVFAMNHPLGGMDAIALVSGLRSHKTGLKFIVNDLLLFLKNMNGLFLGVNKHGKNSLSKREQIEQLFASDYVVSIFPAGLVSRKQKGNIKDLDWKKTFITYSKKNNRTIVPIFIDGHLSPFFYRLSNFRKFLGIKANIEMLYLSNELFKLKGQTIRMIIGQPIPSTQFTEDKTDRKWSEFVKEKVYELEK
ncbi:MAG: 1-acyl-sn-glycerol-3-phosphate acyltransferase [Bacteroidetes bacterium]|nr:1-acyl-sn-glycerol-3-phosphate acyltransferase [Bacteroidota bacterium]